MGRSTSWESEFLSLAGMFLTARFGLLGGVIEDYPGKYDDCGCYVGMTDAAYEMKLLIEEVRSGSLLEHKGQGTKSGAVLQLPEYDVEAYSRWAFAVWATRQEQAVRQEAKIGTP